MTKRILSFCLISVVGGCSLIPDHTLDYRKAAEVAPLKLEGPSRAIHPLYEIPPGQPPSKTIVLTSGSGRKETFVPPVPDPLAVEAIPNVKVMTAPVAATALVKPRLGNDGNGSALLQVDGNADQVWDALGKALQDGNIRIEDKNRSLGLFFVEWMAQNRKVPLQVKLTRMAGTNVLSLQKDDDTVADAALTTEFFDRLLKHWPG